MNEEIRVGRKPLRAGLVAFALLAAAAAARAEDAVHTPAFDTVATARGDLRVYPLNHATMALVWNGVVVYVDPVGGERRFAGLPKPGLILITHAHPDHEDARTVAAVESGQTVIVAPEAVRHDLETQGVDARAIRVLANGKSAKESGVEIEAVPMYNTTPERLRYHAKGWGNGYVLDFAGTRVYVSGDTEDTPEMRRLRDLDVAFVCMNLPFTMTAEQAAAAVLEMKPKVVYPYHYRGPERAGWQDPERFRALVQAQARTVEVRVRDWYAVR